MDIVRRLLNLGIPDLDEGAFQTLGRNSGMRLYGKGGGSAPAPDPLIGQAAMENAQLGKEWLSFAKEQFAVGNERQEITDALTGRVIEQQLESQDKAAKRSDQQWSDYNAMYRPIERMNALDALGAQNMTDEQVMELINSQNTNELTRLQADYEANIAAINAKPGQSVTSSASGGMSEEQANSIARAITGLSQNEIMAEKYPEFAKINEKLASNPLIAAFRKMKGDDGSESLLAKREEITKALMAGGQQAQEIQKVIDGLSPEQRQAMIDAETKRFEAQKASISDVSNQVMAQRQAGRVAEGNAASEAKADVVANYGQQKEMAARQMASMGVNPASGKFAGVTRAQDTNAALAAAGAQNNARKMVRQQGIALRADQANYGRGGSSVAAQQAGIGLNSGNSAVANNASANGNFYQNAGIMNQGFQGNIGANTSAGNMLNTLYGNQVQAWAAEQQANATSAAGIGSMVGTIGGAGISAYF